ncbi:MAG: aspartate--tRNA ligase [Chlamydiota bacterium]
MKKKRTHLCSEITKKEVGQTICLSGWVDRRRDHGGVIFIDLRDRYGIIQLVFNPELAPKSLEIASTTRNEWVISIVGEVSLRSPDMINPNILSGELEVKVREIEILSPANPLPFSLFDEVHEDRRLQYRYLDMRKGAIKNNLQLRHKAIFAIRKFFDEKEFLEIATPILSKSTPEGARDFLVPSRIHPGQFYALPQSPQLYKQILMMGGLDKYFQIAPCFRDEDLRADRQLEFSQIDFEMSFATPDDLYPLVEDLMKSLFSTCLQIDIETPFQKMTYDECLEKYGTDKPDLRFGMPFSRIDDIIQKSTFSLLQQQLEYGSIAKAICVAEGASFSRKEIDDLTSFVSKFGIPGLAWMKKTEEGFSSVIVKYFSPDLLLEIEKRLNVKNGDIVFIAVEEESKVNQALDHLRRHIAKEKKCIDPNLLKFLWVVDFPLFSKIPDSPFYQTERHPFTSPRFDDMSKLDSDPLSIRALAYDLVLNGYELGSGSQRIHNCEIQKKVFALLDISPQEMEDRFGFFLEALGYGTPPHIGMALGIERLVMLLAKTDNIREVIAFPKTQKGTDLMMKTPSYVQEKQIEELHIQISEDA